MANEISKTPEPQQVQTIPLAKIHSLPGITVPKQPDRMYGGLVSSIQSQGVTTPVILRLREDGEYQLISGYRRHRASELAKKQDIPALVYEMPLADAVRYREKQKFQPDTPVPGKLLSAPELDDKAKGAVPADVGAAAGKGKPGQEKDAAPAGADTSGGKDKTDKEKNTAPTGADTTDGKGKVDKEKDATPAGTDATGGKGKADKEKDAAPTGADTSGGKGKAAQEKDATPAGVDATGGKGKADKEKDAAPAGTDTTGGKGKADKEKDTAPTGADTSGGKGKAAQEKDATPAGADATGSKTKADKEKDAAPSGADASGGKGKAAQEKDAAPAGTDTAESKGKTGENSAPKPDSKIVNFPSNQAPAAAPAAKGPIGTAITQIFADRLEPPDEKALNTLPIPEKEGESYFITLHPAYLEKSKFNNFSVDQESENFQELKKAIELAGIKDPVLARPKEGGGLEILSGQRRHMIGQMLNYPIPTIIQKIDDDDAKIIVADSNLHRDKISTYDLSRALRMKMDGMKRKAGRLKKGASKEKRLETDELLAQEMGMKVSKLNRLVRLSEATKEVCDAVDEGRIELSVANALSFLKPEQQNTVLELTDVGYKLTTARIERMKKQDKLTENLMRDILDDKDLAPKTPPKAPAAPATPANPPTPPAGTSPSPSSTPPENPQEKPQEAPATPAVPSASQPPAAGTVPGGTTPPGPAGGETPLPPAPGAPAPPEQPAGSEQGEDVFKGKQERPENTKVILSGDRLRKYYPDVTMTPREIEEDIYDALEERRQRQEKMKAKEEIFKRPKGQER